MLGTEPACLNQYHLTFTVTYYLTMLSEFKKADLKLKSHSTELVLMVIDLFPLASYFAPFI